MRHDIGGNVRMLVAVTVSNDEKQSWIKKFGTVIIAASIGTGCFQQLAPREGIILEKGGAYSNPDEQHLQLNVTRPKPRLVS